MAEGLLRALDPTRFEVASAGTQATRVHPLAVRAMAELDIDISSQRSKSLDRFVNVAWDYMITVCDNAREHCPVFPAAAHRLHWSFADPSQVHGMEREQLRAFRHTRDAIRQHLQAWLVQR